jgi:hypothetical protein
MLIQNVPKNVYILYSSTSYKVKLTDVNPLLCWLPQLTNVQNIYHQTHCIVDKDMQQNGILQALKEAEKQDRKF